MAEAVDREVQRIDGEFQDGLSAGLRRVFFLVMLHDDDIFILYIYIYTVYIYIYIFFFHFFLGVVFKCCLKRQHGRIWS